MNQLVPSWDVQNNSTPPMFPNCTDHNPSHPVDVPVWDNHLKELAWENGQLSMQWFVKASPTKSSSILKQTTHNARSVVNLEPLVDHEELTADDLVPWFDGFSQPKSVPMDPLVPCHLSPVGSERSKKTSVGCDPHSATGCVTFDRKTKEKSIVQSDASFHLLHPHDLSDYLDLDSIYPPSSVISDDQQKGNGVKPSSSTKRTRVAAVHNLSERKRRNGINQRIKTLQSLVPNSTKTDKISVLDEVIEYVKQLTAEAQANDKPPPVIPQAIQSQQHLPMPLVDPMGAGVGLRVGLGLVGMNPMQRPVVPSLPASFLHPTVMMPFQAWESRAGSSAFAPAPVSLLQDPLSAYFKPQPMSLDAYSRMVAFYGQLHHRPSSTSKN